MLMLGKRTFAIAKTQSKKTPLLELNLVQQQIPCGLHHEHFLCSMSLCVTTLMVRLHVCIVTACSAPWIVALPQ